MLYDVIQNQSNQIDTKKRRNEIFFQFTIGLGLEFVFKNDVFL